MSQGRNPRNPFGAMARVWSDDPEAMARIVDWRPVAIRKADYLGRKYPGVDWEPLIMDSLYEAAFSYRDGPAGFFGWFTYCSRGRISSHVRTLTRRAAKLTRVEMDTMTDAQLARIDDRLFMVQNAA